MLKTPRALLALGTLALALSLSLPARAGEPERKAALELVRLVTPPEAYEQMMQQMIGSMLPAMQQQGAQFPPDAAEKMQKALREVLTYDELLNWTADVYATRFSVVEMKQLIVFYKTPVGKKLARLLPELSGEAGKKMGTLLPERLPAALKKYGLAP